MKKLKNKIKSLLLNKKITTILYALLAVIVLAGIIAIFQAQKADPHNPFYPLGRGFEKVGYLFRITPKSKIYYELKLAKERIQEMKTTRDLDKMQMLVDDYKSNLDNVKSGIENMIDSDLDQAQISKIVMDSNTIYFEAFRSSIKVIRGNLQDKEIRKILSEASSYTLSTNDEIFAMAVMYIEDDYEFSKYASDLLARELFGTEQLISYAEQDTALAVDQTDTETIIKLQDLINEMNVLYREVLDGRNTMPNAEKYQKINEIKEKDKVVTEILVGITQSHMKPVSE